MTGFGRIDVTVNVATYGGGFDEANTATVRPMHCLDPSGVGQAEANCAPATLDRTPLVGPPLDLPHGTSSTAERARAAGRVDPMDRPTEAVRQEQPSYELSGAQLLKVYSAFASAHGVVDLEARGALGARSASPAEQFRLWCRDLRWSRFHHVKSLEGWKGTSSMFEASSCG
jgi:hypothetical protein